MSYDAGTADYPVLPGLDEGTARQLGFLGALTRLVDNHSQNTGAEPSDEVVNAMARIAAEKHGAGTSLRTPAAGTMDRSAEPTHDPEPAPQLGEEQPAPGEAPPQVAAGDNGTGRSYEECLQACVELALPTPDYGIQFRRCTHQCRGTNDYPEWRMYFPGG
ncbi:MAG: hypothetical protein M0006_03845 [Magnetospirillum sp.]|nr:hypothetical protein [Magnetospirillum sp.]